MPGPQDRSADVYTPESVADDAPDELQPGGKDPAEGARGPSDSAPAAEHPEESHLGDAGDPAEG